VNSKAFLDAAENTEGLVTEALKQGASVLSENGEKWSRKVEEAIYNGYQAPYPLNLER
jgi:hypothetical protein